MKKFCRSTISIFCLLAASSTFAQADMVVNNTVVHMDPDLDAFTMSKKVMEHKLSNQVDSLTHQLQGVPADSRMAQYLQSRLTNVSQRLEVVRGASSLADIHKGMAALHGNTVTTTRVVPTNGSDPKTVNPSMGSIGGAPGAPVVAGGRGNNNIVAGPQNSGHVGPSLPTKAPDNATAPRAGNASGGGPVNTPSLGGRTLASVGGGAPATVPGGPAVHAPSPGHSESAAPGGGGDAREPRAGHR